MNVKKRIIQNKYLAQELRRQLLRRAGNEAMRNAINSLTDEQIVEKYLATHETRVGLNRDRVARVQTKVELAP